jgi:hypothetical protein
MSLHEGTEHYLPFLKRLLTPQRLQHSLGVMQVIGESAGIYSLDRTRAVTAGLLHDAAKDLGPEQQLALAEEAGIEIHYPCERTPLYLHGPVGAYLRDDTYTFQYLARATIPGDFQVLPGQAYPMYYPDVYGRGQGKRLVVEE